MGEAVLGACDVADVGHVLTAERLNPKQLTALIGSLGAVGPKGIRALDWTMSWAKQQRQLLNVVHYSSYIKHLGQRGRWEDALAEYDSMKAAGACENETNEPPTTCLKPDVRRGGAGVEPNDYTYQALISACGKAGQWEAAEALFEVCGASGVQPDFLLYGTLMSAYEKGAQWERAEALFEQMVAAGAWVSVGRRAVQGVQCGG